ncbi:dTDP-4-dehydrorhamnose reductase [Acerihabitans arboris]|uniref:dTDP-4-dehydrorhamnose reductase n=1 Tax=Acerihabitans arboris TaxID=2691583 RepID=A0A845SG07_9GAMM|nr:dTDP-4-dehydrorhamnose reductase [Acerihabitans arboris]NDL62312.1 dTDP-4-dehydrorhamnose reductase [Acerihabitans arboris]
MKVLLTGANGQLGRCFQDRVPAGWQVMATDSDTLDITDASAVDRVAAAFQPGLVVNAAAYTAVDKAESDAARAALINAGGPANLARAAKRAHAGFIHISTDYVFDGTSKTPYVETDATHPLGVYGATKLDGEIAVMREYPQSIIIRTAWVFSEYGNNFVKTMLRLGRERAALSIVDDQRGCPTYAGDIAQAIIDMTIAGADGGIYHFCGDREVSWKEFTDEIMTTAARLDLLDALPIVKGIGTDQYPTAAQRPGHSTLSCAKIARYGIRPSDWAAALNSCMAKIA